MKLLMLGSGGELEVMAPATDDERRDLETHIRGQFTRGFIFQVKSTTYLDRRFKARRLSIHFPVAKDRLVSHPLFWYLPVGEPLVKRIVQSMGIASIVVA
jgi:hypothetical protein